MTQGDGVGTISPTQTLPISKTWSAPGAVLEGFLRFTETTKDLSLNNG